jgi:hypothetical protein
MRDDDLLGPDKEEPDCHACGDLSCRRCAPTPTQRTIHRWGRKGTPSDEPPF